MTQRGRAAKPVPMKAPFAALLGALLAVPAMADLVPPPSRERIAGLALVRVAADGAVNIETEGCAVYAGDGVTCEKPLTAQSIFRVASISKLVAALGVMRLVEEGRLDLDRDVSDYLGWSLRNPAFPDQAITLRMILAHTSSLRDGDYVMPLGTRVAEKVREAQFWSASKGPADGYFAYSNTGFVVLGTIMEAATGERFDRLMTRLVLAPLGLDAGYNWSGVSDAGLANAAALYRTAKEAYDPDAAWVVQIDDLKGVRPACPVVRASPDDPCDLEAYVPGTHGGLFGPQGGLRISPEGLGKIARLILGGGEVDGVRLLKPETLDAMMTPAWIADGTNGSIEGESASMCAYGISMQALGLSNDPCRDNVFGDGRVRWGHLAEAWGLYGGFWIDREAGTASIYLVTGTSTSPWDRPGTRSAFTALEEELSARLLTR